ncbi:uncharacterized protein I303_105369 [Kwoniella dejecticola CBS 10117]|uniref:Fungal specific transcription factor n=1 Tax=Kwoniella dejecticola CBS 10117 TaxID=1296121 RepID=A0A1A6A2N9_9TREE|nr:fungal specific transcription factor [Kwoniella dejecticola CBS 10117]OBR84327.1 fungal specific transcription factor [Kwoniella dejecticola CBS 10117]
MKVPSDRHSDPSYAPYSVTSPRSFQQPALPNRTSSSSGSKKQQPPPIKTEDSTSQYKVARAISSCTRCRSRKQKCDGKLPACSACERAKVECIGFDAISKTNISRNYLHSLEQEVTSLRAQVAALQQNDPIGRHKKDIAANASSAVSSFRSDFPIDPALMHEDGNSTVMRSPLESPSLWGQGPGSSATALGHGHQRRHSDYPFPSTPLSSDSPKSPYQRHIPGHGQNHHHHHHHATGQTVGIQSTSLTRMVHDAAYRTGHASNSIATSINPSVAGSNSDKGSSVHGGSTDSPIMPTNIDPHLANHSNDGSKSSPENVLTPRSSAAMSIPNSRRQPSASPLANPAQLLSSSLSSVGKSKRRTFTIPPLPPQPAVERLVAAYVDFVGVTGPIIHIPSLGKQLMKIREGTDVEEADIFVVMMVLALSTMASSRFVDPPDELRACSEAFHSEAMKHLDAVFEEQSYVGLQAILLLVWYSLLNPDKGSIWFLVGLATRTCVDLGYHNEHNTQVDQIDSLELDMRRRLFWCTYKMDRLLSQSLGRPPSIPDGFINVPLPSSMHDIDIHPNHYGPLEGETCSYKAVFLHTTKMRQLQSEILFNTYGVHGSTGRLPSEEWRQDCFDRLKTWLAEAPEPRGTVSTEGYAISFHNSCLLLFRPSPGSPRPGRSALSTVLTSSSYVIRIYRRMQLNNRISWLWMTSHFSFMAGLSFLYAYFNLYSMGGGSDIPSIEDALMVIDSCLGVLEFLSPRVPSASECHNTMQALSQAIFDQLSKLDPPPTMNSSSSSPGRGLLRGAPISSSREDPLPNEAFPTPLPAVALPYELSLLDNLFRNPMASHNKASEYTSNQKCRNKKKKEREQINVDYGGVGNYGPPSASSHSHSNSHSHGENKGYPPNAFHHSTSDQIRRSYGSGGNNDNSNGNGLDERRSSDVGDYTTAASLLGPYTLAMGLGQSGSFGNSTNGSMTMSTSIPDNPTNTFQNQNVSQHHQHQQDPTNQNQNQNQNQSQTPIFAQPSLSQSLNANLNANANTHERDLPMINGSTETSDQAENGFDLFSFLMDEDGLGGNGFTALDVPTDFSLWS